MQVTSHLPLKPDDTVKEMSSLTKNKNPSCLVCGSFSLTKLLPSPLQRSVALLASTPPNNPSPLRREEAVCLMGVEKQTG